MTDELLTIYHHRVTCIVSTLKPDYNIGNIREQIDNFPLTLIPPLGSYYHGCGHWAPSSRARETPSYRFASARLTPQRSENHPRGRGVSTNMATAFCTGTRSRR